MTHTTLPYKSCLFDLPIKYSSIEFIWLIKMCPSISPYNYPFYELLQITGMGLNVSVLSILGTSSVSHIWNVLYKDTYCITVYVNNYNLYISPFAPGPGEGLHILKSCAVIRRAQSVTDTVTDTYVWRYVIRHYVSHHS